MSNVPLARSMLRTAQPLVPRSRPQTLMRATPIQENEQIFSEWGELITKKVDLGPIVINVNVAAPAAASVLLWGSFQNAALNCIAQLFLQEAPAWGASMLVHMVMLVSMALVTVPDASTYKTQQLIVTPPEEEKVEEIREANSEQPTTLEEDATLGAVAFEATVERDAMDIQPSDEPEVTSANVDLSDYGMERAPKSDLLTMLGMYGGMGLAARGSTKAQAQLVMQEGASESSEKAVLTALRWLANHQLHNGSWSFDHGRSPTCQGKCRNPGTLTQANTAATALALLPFLGSGQTHMEGKYRTAIKRGLAYLVDNMRMGSKGGSLWDEHGRMYGHGLAAIALCEAYGMTHDEELRIPAQRALDFITYAQDEEGGGWRYKPQEPGDTSVVGWQLMALKSGCMSGLDVPALTIHRASLFLDSVQKEDGATYGYTNNADGTEATAAIGTLCRMYLGWKRGNPDLQRGVEFISRHGPSGANMYYNYYATQVMRHWEGETWENWNRQMRDQLVHSQAKQGHEDGSWFSGTGDNGADPGGRLYSTAMATMILEVYYRNLPLYRPQSVDQDFPE